IAVNLYGDLGIFYLQVAGDVLQLRQRAQALLKLGGVLVQLIGVRALQRELVLALGERAANADGRQVLQVDIDAGNLHQLRPEFLDDLVHMGPLAARLEPGEDASGVESGVHPAPAYGGHVVVHVGAVSDDFGGFFLVAHHVLKGDPLDALGESKKIALVFAGRKPLGMAINSHAVAPITTKESISVAKGCAMTFLRLQSYPERKASKAASVF